MRLAFKITIIMLLLTAFFPVSGDYFRPQSAYAQDGWRGEFDDICSKTNDSMNLSDEELKNLIGRAEKLKAVIEKLDESDKKVYGRRLQKCRDLLDFVLSTRKKV